MAGDAEFTQPDPVIADEIRLHRALGPFSLIMIGIGSIIGAGIFVYAGTAAATHAGPAVLLSFGIAGIGCLFAGLCYAEFASMIPESGSSYTYAYATMGRFMAWFIGWNMVLEYGVSASGVAAGWSGYFVSFLQYIGIPFPAVFANAPIEGHGVGDLHWTGAIVNLPAVVLIVALTTLLVVGMKESARFNNVMVLIKVGIILVVILFGLPYVRGEQLHAVHPAQYGTVRPFRHHRHTGRRGDRVLRLHRLRGGLGGGAGVQESAGATCPSAFSARSSSARRSTS